MKDLSFEFIRSKKGKKEKKKELSWKQWWEGYTMSSMRIWWGEVGMMLSEGSDEGVGGVDMKA